MLQPFFGKWGCSPPQVADNGCTRLEGEEFIDATLEEDYASSQDSDESEAEGQ